MDTEGTEDTEDDTAVPDGATVTIPSTLYDTATLTDATADAGGTATYYYQKQDDDPETDPVCDNLVGTSLGTFDVTDGDIPDSNTVILDETGEYEFWVEY